jgi:ribonuclease HI
MPWTPATFKGARCWAAVEADGRPVIEDGRRPIRYSDREGATLYRAAARAVVDGGGAPVTLPPGRAAAPSPPAPSAIPAALGKAGTRSAAQATSAKAQARQQLEALPLETIVVYADGACRGNPGPAGSGAVVMIPGRPPLERWRAHGQATNNIAELSAVGLALDALAEAGTDESSPVMVFTDSKYAIGVLSQNWKANANAELVAELRSRLRRWPALRWTWVAGHAGIEGNERADALARRGVEGSSSVG